MNESIKRERQQSQELKQVQQLQEQETAQAKRENQKLVSEILELKNHVDDGQRLRKNLEENTLLQLNNYKQVRALSQHPTPRLLRAHALAPPPSSELTYCAAPPVV